MDYQDLINQIVLGGILGIIGQGLRTVIGLKKLREEAGEKGQSFAEVFQPSTLIVSLFVGFIAGAVAILLLDNVEVLLKEKLTRSSTIMGLIASGYAGTDFIEGALSRVLPQGGSAAPAPPPGSVDRQLPAPVGPRSEEEIAAATYRDEPSYAPPGWANRQDGAEGVWR